MLENYDLERSNKLYCKTIQAIYIYMIAYQQEVKSLDVRMGVFGLFHNTKSTPNIIKTQ
jgi:hypothetical protein